MTAKEIYAQGGTRTCTQCGETQANDREHFGSKDGGIGVKNRCRQCERNNTNKHYRNDPEKARARADKSKSNRDVLSWSGTIELARMVRRQDNRCYYCDCHMTKSDVTVDHKTPVSKGGKDSPDNLVACCRVCNINKRDKTEAEYWFFLQRVGKRGSEQ